MLDAESIRVILEELLWDRPEPIPDRVIEEIRNTYKPADIPSLIQSLFDPAINLDS